MRWSGTAAVFLLSLLSGCAWSDQAMRFKNPKTGAVAEACAPLIGLRFAVDEVEHGCAKAYEKAGWVRVTAPD